jgi:hypothetical protein
MKIKKPAIDDSQCFGQDLTQIEYTTGTPQLNKLLGGWHNAC